MKAVPNGTFPVDDDIAGDAHDAEVSGDGTLVVKDNGKGHLVLLLYLDYSILRFVKSHIDGYYLVGPGSFRCPELFQGAHIHEAFGAPGGPEDKVHHLIAAVIFKVNRLSLQGCQGEIQGIFCLNMTIPVPRNKDMKV